MVDLKKYIEIISSILRQTDLALCLCLFTSCILFCHENILQLIGVVKFSEEYRFVIGFVFLGSIIVLLIKLKNYMYSWLCVGFKAFKNRVDERKLSRQLDNLPEEEKAVLAVYLHRNIPFQCFSMTPAVARLLGKKIIYRKYNSEHKREMFYLTDGVIEKIALQQL